MFKFIWLANLQLKMNGFLTHSELFHMTPHGEYFTKFLEINKGQVSMGNDDFSRKIKGIRKTFLKLKNG